MTRFFLRTLAIVMFCLGLLSPVTTLAADSTPSQGLITVIVKDEAGKSIPGNWFLYQGISNQNLMIRNGSKGETFLMPEGQYFLVAQTVYGYDHPVIVNANPQALTASGHVSFEVKYPFAPVPPSQDAANVFSAERLRIAQEAAKRASRDLNKAAASNADEVQMITAPTVSTFIPAEMPAVTEVTAEPVTTTSFELATTGPGMIGIFAFSSLLSGFAVFKRKNA